VELAAVELALKEFPGIKDAAVLGLDNARGDKCLVAYLVARKQLDTTAVRHFLQGLVADYMIPSQYVFLDTMPQTASGKTDRLALPKLRESPDGADQDYDVLSPSAGDPELVPKESASPQPSPPKLRRNALEISLYGLFSRVLRRKDFGIHDSFFDLGGDSIAAALLFGQITSLLHIELPLTELKKHPTVRRLANRIQKQGWNLTDHPVTLLTPTPAPGALNLFAWNGAGGDVIGLYDLACHLGPGVALHSIQYRGADGRRVYDLSLNDMADRSTQLIRRVQPRGPYALCGTSSGGLLAMEVARRLRNLGESVSFLGLLDTYAPGYPRLRRRLGIKERIELSLRALRPWNEKDKPGLEVLKRGVREQWIRFIARRSVRRPDPHTPQLPIEIRFIYLAEACFIASRQHRLEPYDGEVHLFRAETPPPEKLFEFDEKLGWSGYLTGPLRITEIAGCHHRHLKEPNVSSAAAKLRLALMKTRV
jgi:fengycin family lipopeptide synthetase D